MWRSGVEEARLFSDPFGCRCLTRFSVPCFHTPLIKPDVRISRIRLSDKDSRFRPRKVARTPTEPDQAQLLVQVGEGEACRPPSLYFVLSAQPRTEPLADVEMHVPIGSAHRA